MNKEIINQINEILNKKEIDERIKPLIKLYFLGKSNTIDIEQIKPQIDLLCSKISNVEFSSNNIITAYQEKAAKILSYINNSNIKLSEIGEEKLVNDIKLFTGCT